jgi:DNA polymerase-4
VIAESWRHLRRSPDRERHKNKSVISTNTDWTPIQGNCSCFVRRVLLALMHSGKIMRKPENVEKLYLDFDGFFASVMQQAFPELRGRPVGVIPFPAEGLGADSTCVIACSKEAKAAGCKNVMSVPDARAACPDIVLVPQRVDLFRRAHNALLNEIRCEIPIEVVKSIDEMACKLDKTASADPHGLAARIKDRIAANVGPYITCSIGFAANRLLAKIACKVDKPNGVTVWDPRIMPSPLIMRPMSDIPGIGTKIQRRLEQAGLGDMISLWNSQPKHLRAIWGNVNGERMWYALHGYDLHAQPTERGMYGHSRVLPPGWRDMEKAQASSRLLLTKAARRMRRGGFFANKLLLWLGVMDKSAWSKAYDLPCVQDDQAILRALGSLWDRANRELPRHTKLMMVAVTLGDLTPASERQLDLLMNDDPERKKAETITNTIDNLNRKFGKRVVTIGPWVTPPGGYTGGKIAYNRIPSAEDFW